MKLISSDSPPPLSNQFIIVTSASCLRHDGSIKNTSILVKRNRYSCHKRGTAHTIIHMNIIKHYVLK